jgi:cytochrome P450
VWTREVVSVGDELDQVVEADLGQYAAANEILLLERLLANGDEPGWHALQRELRELAAVALVAEAVLDVAAVCAWLRVNGEQAHDRRIVVAELEPMATAETKHAHVPKLAPERRVALEHCLALQMHARHRSVGGGLRLLLRRKRADQRGRVVRVHASYHAGRVQLAAGKSTPPGKLGLPIIGDTLRFLADPLAYMQRRAGEHGLVFKAGIIGKPTVFMLGPEANEFVLGTHVRDFSWREGYGPAAFALFGDALIMRDGEDYAAIKRAILPVFNKDRLATQLPDIERIVTQSLAAAATGARIDLYPLFKRLSLRVAVQVLIGHDVGPDDARLVELFNRFSAGLFTPFATRIPGSAFARAWRARTQLRAYLSALVERPQAREGEHLTASLLQAEDAAGRPLSNADVVSQLVLMLFAGHDTTASLSTWLAFELMRRADVRERARAEVLDVCGADGPLTIAQLARLDYVTACIREAERLYPPAPTGFRGVTRALEFRGLAIPQGWTVVYSPLFTHHMPELYPEPHRYDPERFMRASDRPGYSLIGFGGGMRKCVGEALAQLELKVIVATWLRSVSSELLTEGEPRWDYIPALHPKGGLLARLRLS